MKRFGRKVMCLLVSCSLFAIGSCALDSWKLAAGPIWSGDSAYGGVELEFSNGIDFIVPMVGLGDNLDW